MCAAWATLLAGTAGAARSVDAVEYAIRWAPVDGGPADAKAALLALGLSNPKTEQFAIRYFAARELPPDAPAGFKAILRERVEGTQPTATWKYRGSGGFPAPALAQWKCPLVGSNDRKDEADVSWLADGPAPKTYSRSCSADATLAASVPPELKPEARGCASTMTRLSAKKIKVEEWHVGGKQVVIEVSWKAGDSKADARKFKTRVADPLLALKVHPIDRSKSEMGSQCPA